MALPVPVSHGAELLLINLRRIRVGKSGHRRVGRNRLAALLRRTARQVSTYIAELKQAGYLAVIPPPRVKTRDGWRTVGVNTYIVTDPNRITAGQSGVKPASAPPLTGSRGRPPRGTWGGPADPIMDTLDYLESRPMSHHELIALLDARDLERYGPPGPVVPARGL